MRLIIRELHGYITDLCRLEFYIRRLSRKYIVQPPEPYFVRVTPYVATLYQLTFVRDVHEYYNAHMQQPL